MSIINTCWEWFKTYVFTQPALFMAILVFIGYVILKRKWYECFSGAMKAFLGYSVFSIASGGMVNTFRPILLGLKDAFGWNATVSDPYFGMGTINSAIMPDLGRSLSIYGVVLVLGFVISILLALAGKVTKIRTLNVAGNCLNAFAMMNTSFIALCMPQLTDMQLIICSSIFTGLSASVYSNFTVEAAQTLTDGCGMAVGHSQNMFNAFAFWLGKKEEERAAKQGKTVKHYEDVEFPGWLSIFNDVYVSAAIVMFVFFGIMIVAIGRENMMAIDPSLTPTSSFFMYIFNKTMNFPVYMIILMTGLRMFVGEMTAAFNGISEKLLRGTLPAVDCAAFYGFVESPNVLTIGFLIGSISMTACTLIGALTGMPFVIIMGFIPMFFDNATVAIFAHIKGGIKTQIICNVLTGIIDVMLGGIACMVAGYLKYGGAGMNVDNSLTMGVFGFLMKNLGMVGFVVIVVILLAMPQILYMLNKDTYWLAAKDWEKFKEVKAAKAAK